VSALEQAHADLRARSAAADRAGDWREARLLEALGGVADYVKRIGDHPGSAHYRADKAGDLVIDAVHVLRLAFLAYAGWPQDTPQAAAIRGAVDALQTTCRAVERALWSNTRTGGVGVFAFDLGAIGDAARTFVRWADALAATAVPDADEEDW